MGTVDGDIWRSVYKRLRQEIEVEKEGELYSSGVSTEGDWAILALGILGGVKVGSSWREQPSETARGAVGKVPSLPSHVTCALVHMYVLCP